MTEPIAGPGGQRKAGGGPIGTCMYTSTYLAGRYSIWIHTLPRYGVGIYILRYFKQLSILNTPYGVSVQ